MLLFFLVPYSDDFPPPTQIRGSYKRAALDCWFLSVNRIFQHNSKRQLVLCAFRNEFFTFRTQVATVCPFAGIPGVGRHGNGTWLLRRRRRSFPNQETVRLLQCPPQTVLEFYQTTRSSR